MQRLIRRALALGIELAMGALALAGCRSADIVDFLTPRDDYRLESDIAYGEEPRQRLDLYRPLLPKDDSRPVVLFFYGGNWMEGSKADYRFVGESLAKAGYVIAIADYRLFPTVRFPAFVEDGAAATAWMAAHLRTGDGTPRPIVLMGHSAGAYIAAMLATDKRYLDRDDRPGRRVVRAWVGLAGPYQFEPEGVNALILASPDGRATMAADAADAETPPAFLLVAAEDEVVGQINVDRLEARFRRLGVPVTRTTYPGLHHATLVGALSSKLTFLGPVRADVLAYLAGL